MPEGYCLNTREDPHQITVSQLSGVTAKTYTLVLSASDFSIVSYSTNDGDHVFTATASDSSTMDVTINTSNVMQSTGIQFKKSNAGVMYNKTDLGTITSLTTVAKTGKEDVSTKNIGATQNPSSNAGEGGYFKLSSTKTANLESITRFSTFLSRLVPLTVSLFHSTKTSATMILFFPSPQRRML